MYELIVSSESRVIDEIGVRILQRKTYIYTIWGVIGLIAFIIISVTLYLNNEQDDFVSTEDINFNVLNVEEKGENTFFITAEIINNSNFDLETNHIYIDELNHATQQETSSTISGNTNSSSNTLTVDDEQPAAIPVINHRGNFNSISANNSIEIGFEYQLEEHGTDELIILFRSDEYRDDRDALTKYYTIITTSTVINK